MSLDALSIKSFLSEKVSIRVAILTTVGLLVAIGLLAVLSSSSIAANEAFGDPTHYFKKQLWVAGIGFTLVFIIGHTDLKILDRAPIVIYLFSLILLVLTLIPSFGYEVKGASRWLRLWGVGFQPAELAKIAVVLLVAKNLARREATLQAFGKGVGSSLAILAAVCTLLLIQPDFGTAALIAVTVLCMMVCRGLARHFVVFICSSGFVVATALIYFSPYRLKRILVFLDPWKDYSGGGFQIIQSLIGFKAGGLLGRGIGESKQKLYFLPDAHNDFILSVIAEELGLAGIIGILFLFSYLTYLGFKIYSLQENPFRRFAALGITLLIAFQAIINIGVALAVLPPKGIPLPFISNGASSLLCFLFAIGMLTRYSQIDSGKANG